MKITYQPATAADIAPICDLCEKLIRDYEQLDQINLPFVMDWVRRKIQNNIGEYTLVCADGEKAGYYHFYRNEDGLYEIDDLYVLPPFQNRGIGTGVIEECCRSVREPVMLYVFIKNERAVSLYQRLGFRIVETLRGSRYVMRNDNRKYYAAYDERYKTAHEKGVSWASDRNTPVVLETIRKYGIQPVHELLEIGCGEGRDARALLAEGYHALLATDISPEAIAYCQKTTPQHGENFRVLDCLSQTPGRTFDFVYAVAVIHMLVQDEDRQGFYRFVRDCLKPGGYGLICTMGDGEAEMQSDISRAFELQERSHPSGKMLVAGTSCRMVSFPAFRRELAQSNLQIVEEGITSAMPEFDRLMYAVVQRNPAEE